MIQYFLQDSTVFTLRERVCEVNLPFLLLKYSNPPLSSDDLSQSLTAADSQIKLPQHLDAGTAFFENRIKEMWRSVFQGKTSVKHVNKCSRSRLAKDQIPNHKGIHVSFNNIAWALAGSCRPSCSEHASKYNNHKEHASLWLGTS